MKRIFSMCILSLVIIAIAISNIPSPTVYKVNHIEFYDKNGVLFTSEIENKTGEYIYLEELNNHTINAFVAFEDKNFYSHHGFDFLRIVKSFFKNIFSLSFSQGASTITQQYARTVFLNNKKSLIRKIKEAYYTSKLERKYTKNQILEGYLNTIYLGHGCYGVDAASKYYFNKSAKDLTLIESATLASLASSPNTSSPYIDYNKSKQRRNNVLLAMKKEKYISDEQYINSISLDINLNQNHIIETNVYYYLDQVKQLLKENTISLKKGLKIYTNIDLDFYQKITPLIEKYNYNNNQLSLVILENNSNKILFNIGGISYNNTPYNRSIYSKRQVGSTIKTFLYSFALENNFTLNTKLLSEKTTFNIKDYGLYSPSNSNDIYANYKIDMKEAYAVSDNIYATKTLLLLGSDKFKEYLKKFNLYTTESVPSIALGSCELTLFDLTKAYSVYANDGYYYNYSFVNKITNSYNKILYQSSESKNQVIKKSTLTDMKELMSLPFSNNNYYTKSTLSNYNIKGYLGKSGSTSNDSYLIFFNDKYTIGIWLGNDDNNKLYDYTTSKYLARDISKIL